MTNEEKYSLQHFREISALLAKGYAVAFKPGCGGNVQVAIERDGVTAAMAEEDELYYAIEHALHGIREEKDE